MAASLIDGGTDFIATLLEIIIVGNVINAKTKPPAKGEDLGKPKKFKKIAKIKKIIFNFYFLRKNEFMKSSEIIKRLYHDYSKNFLGKIFLAAFSAIFGSLSLSIFIQGFLISKLLLIERFGYIVVTFCLLSVSFTTDIIGFVLFIILYLFHYFVRNSKRQLA